jgi:hypothetical protein
MVIAIVKAVKHRLLKLRSDVEHLASFFFECCNVSSQS